MSQETIKLTAGVSVTTPQENIEVQDLFPNNYLTIIWKDKSGDTLNTLDIDDEEKLEYTMALNNAINTAISNNNIQYAGQNKFVNVESIAKYLAQNALATSPKRTVANALIGLISGNTKKTPDNIVNLGLNLFGNIADKTARDLGLSDPHEIFSQLAGENTISVLSKLGENTQNFLDNAISKITGNKSQSKDSTTTEGGKKYVGLLLGLTTNDTETYETTIPRKKVEDGSDYTTHLLPQPFKKSFNVMLTNKILTSDFNQTTEIKAIEYTKDKLIEIAQSYTLCDIYIRLNNDVMYKRSNVAISSLEFNKDPESGNSYTASFTVEPVQTFKTKIFVSNKNYSKGSGASSNSGIGSSKSSKTSGGNPLEVGYYNNPSMETYKAKNLNDALQVARSRGLYLLWQQKNTADQFGSAWSFIDPGSIGYTAKYPNAPVLLKDIRFVYYYDAKVKTLRSPLTQDASGNVFNLTTGGNVYKILK